MPRTQRSFFKHWRAKLASLVLATVLWLVIKHGIAYTPAPPPVPPPNVSAAPRA